MSDGILPGSFPTSTLTDSQTSSTSSYSYSADILRQRNVPLKEEVKHPSPTHDEKMKDGAKEDMFECNICLDMACNPIVTMCGHLYCWTCIHQWLTSPRSAANTCPVCKSEIKKETCIPIYCRGRENKDPRTSIPERPSATRTEPPPRSGFRFNMFNSMDGNSNGMNLAIGGAMGLGSMFLGLPFIGVNVNVQRPRPGPGPGPRVNEQDYEEGQLIISRIFMMISVLVLMGILFG